MRPFFLLKELLWFDLWVGLFLFQRLIEWGDRIAWKLLRYDRKTQYLRKGNCRRTGLCCQTLAIEVPASWLRRPWLLRLVRGWYARVHNFQSLGEPQGRLLPFECGHLRAGNLCSIYPYRPKLCRDYPFLSLFGHIELHRGCGFWFLERDKVGTFSEALKEKEHEADRPLRETTLPSREEG